MDWECYKRICDEPQVFSRWMLEQTRELVGPRLGACIDPAALGLPYNKPVDHRGGGATDMFRLALDRAVVGSIHRAVQTAVLDQRRSSGTRERGLGGFEEAWAEYLQSFDSLPGRPEAADAP
ncbi:MAG: hypothetical protein AAGE43_10260 [Pseudomonadota bacterium]